MLEGAKALLLFCLGTAHAAIPAVPCNKQGVDSLQWTDAASLGLHGRATFGSPPAAWQAPYNRLPASASAAGAVRNIIWSLSRMPAGLFVQFRTDAACVFVNYTLASNCSATGYGMWHFPATGVAGMDLYSWDNASGAANASWRWTGTAKPQFPHAVAKLASLSCGGGGGGSLPCRLRTYRLHLPTYAAIKSISIGVNAEAAPPAPESASCPTGLDSGRAPIIWYGSSILQGAVASRPGQVNTREWC